MREPDRLGNCAPRAFERKAGKIEPHFQPASIGHDHSEHVALDRMDEHEPQAMAWQTFGFEAGGEEFRQSGRTFHDATPTGSIPSRSCHVVPPTQLTLLSSKNARTRTRATRYRRFNPAAKCDICDTLDIVFVHRNMQSRTKNNQGLVVGVVWDTSLSTEDFSELPF